MAERQGGTQVSIESGDVGLAVPSGDLCQGPASPHCESVMTRGCPLISMCYVMISILEKSLRNGEKKSNYEGI